MTGQTRHLHREILQVLRKADIPYDPLLPAQIKTVTATNRLRTDTDAFIGMVIFPGRTNVLIRPKTFVVETTRLERQSFITTYSVVVMDAAGALRLVPDLTVDHTDLDRLGRFIEHVADLVDEQARYNSPPRATTKKTMAVLHDAAIRIGRTPTARWPGLIILILEHLQGLTTKDAYGRMLAELGLAIEVWELEGTW